MNTYEQKALDPTIVNAARRQSQCGCKAQTCISQFNQTEMVTLRDAFHTALDQHKTFFLHSLSNNAQTGLTGHIQRTEWQIFGKRTCVDGLCKVLGIGIEMEFILFVFTSILETPRPSNLISNLYYCRPQLIF